MGEGMKKFLYEEMSWPEVKEVVGEDRVVIQPVGIWRIMDPICLW
jgi:hypothetical protein